MKSPQAGPFETKHQSKAVHEQSQSVRNKVAPAARNSNDETGSNRVELADARAAAEISQIRPRAVGLFPPMANGIE